MLMKPTPSVFEVGVVWAVEEYGVINQVDFIVGAFGKALHQLADAVFAIPFCVII